MLDIPYGNLTALNKDIVRGWELSAERRGTSDILYSCLVTITLCIYTAIHLNIPDPREKYRQKTLRLLKWVLIGIFAPEWVIYAAWTQWRDARSFLSYIHKHVPESQAVSRVNSQKYNISTMAVASDDEESQSLNHEENTQPGNQANTTSSQNAYSKGCHVADMPYAFYAMMGGFRVDVSDISDQIDSVVLSKEALEELIVAGGYRYIQLDAKLIEDRSKANNLAKLLVCSQVLWMATQCIARKAFGMPLTLLELHTFAHVLCALCIYIFWFKKPLSVNEATTITLPDEFRGKIAYVVGLHHKQVFAIRFRSPNDTEETMVHVTEQAILHATSDNVHQRVVDYTITAELQKCSTVCQNIIHVSGDSRHRKMTIWYDPSIAESRIDVRLTPHGPNPTIEELSKLMFRVHLPLNDKDKLRWRLALASSPKDLWHSRWELLQTYTNTRQTTYPITAVDETDGLVWKWLSVIFGEILNRLEGASILFVLAIFVTCAYGGIHLSAWNWSFPSTTESWLWRIAGMILVAAIPILFTLALLVAEFDDSTVIKKLKEWLPEKAYSVVEFMLELGVFSTAIPILIAYPFARVFLVVEVFLSLRAVPIGVYATVPWTQYIPHI